MPDSLLITGPPASGKSHAALGRFHSIDGSVLIVPSATQAEHVAHQLARAGHAIRSQQVQTFAGFLELRAGPAPSAFLLHQAIGEAMDELRPPSFAEVAGQGGFREALARLIDEVPARAMQGDLAAVLSRAEAWLAARDSSPRPSRLRLAQSNPADLPPHLVFDGFFSFSRDEMNLLLELASRTNCTLTLPTWPGTEAMRGELLAHGFREQRCESVLRQDERSYFSASTLEGEVDEIASRVLEEAQRGRPFRDMGIVLRSREPYAAALEMAFGRFGIPARFYFADPLADHPSIAFFAAIVRALLRGWQYDDLLTIAQMPGAGLPDSFEFELREHVPGAGLPLAWLAESPPFLKRLAALDSWRRERASPKDWASRLRALREIAPPPALPEKFSREELRRRQTIAFALDAFDRAMESIAAIGDAPLGLAEFWEHAEAALAVESLRVPDRRNNVVHVLDVYEARQWELPLVFICGLVEGRFPQYAREDPIFNDAERRRAGLRTSAESQADEPRLFELAATRATEKTIFSYPRFNEKGDPSVVSFFLSNATVEPCGPRAYPRPSRVPPAVRASPIEDPGLLAQLARQHRELAPSPIEDFLQCPFLFFARRTMRLRARPKAPRDRLDVRLQGTILHRALAELVRSPLFGADLFDEIFEQECARERVPSTYRTEAVRLEMRRNFERFAADARVAATAATRVEESFKFALNPLLTLRGRIDRLDLLAGNRALVIDYKYSAAAKIRERTGEDQAGNLVQGGLYLLAAERQFGLKPAGMLYCGLRKSVAWGGWHLPQAELDGVGEVVTEQILREMIQAAAAKASEVFDAISSGRIAAQPADKKKCAWCDYQDICRVETLAAAKAAAP